MTLSTVVASAILVACRVPLPYEAFSRGDGHDRLAIGREG
jgi:hypothetical protein